jgi:hypothetical protein
MPLWCNQVHGQLAGGLLRLEYAVFILFDRDGLRVQRGKISADDRRDPLKEGNRAPA